MPLRSPSSPLECHLISPCDSIIFAKPASGSVTLSSAVRARSPPPPFGPIAKPLGKSFVLQSSGNEMERSGWSAGKLTVFEFGMSRSEEHTSELQSQFHLVCRLLLEKKNNR